MSYKIFKNGTEKVRSQRKQHWAPEQCILHPITLVRMRDKQYLKSESERARSKWKPRYRDQQADVIDLVLHSCSSVAPVDGAKMRLNQDTGNL